MKTRDESVADAIQSIRGGHYKGTYLKLELEANLGRSSDDDEEGYCDNCSGDGWFDCDSDHDEIRDDEGNLTGDYELSCEHCEEGHVDCSDCDGRGRWDNDDNWGLNECENYILDHVSQACRDATVYTGFIYDGSVDSEFKFTVPLSIEGLGYAIEYIKAFKRLSGAIGEGLDVKGAGMHITVLRSESGSYPIGNPSLKESWLYNFESNMDKLMPALLLLASPDYRSRGLNYRMPKCGRGQHRFAIDVAGGGRCGALEWRVFETCYDRPEMLFDYICTIAKGLQFYAPKIKQVKCPRRIGELVFVDDQAKYGLHKYYTTEKHLTALDWGLDYLIPDHRSKQEVYKLRNFRVTPEVLAKTKARILQKVEEEWTPERRKRIQEEEKQWIDYRMHDYEEQYRYENGRSMRKSRRESILESLKLDYRERNAVTKAQYIKRRLEGSHRDCIRATVNI